MQVHLVDGTYELFRHYYAVPEHLSPDGTEVGATRGVVGSMMQLLEEGATHVGVATDHIIESFRNELWPGYKTGDGVDPDLKAQFPLVEDALAALGLTVWAEVELEADDALASAAAVAEADPAVERVVVCTPDKDLAQCVRDPRVVQLDRRNGTLLDEAAVRAKFGVPPSSIPDWLALVGDSADGFPGLTGWGAKSAAAVLATYEHLDAIPDNPRDWTVDVRGATRLAGTLASERPLAERFRVLATLRTDADVGVAAAWRWNGPTDQLGAWAEWLGSPSLVARAHRLAEART
jgi:5'-3' exonuclease